MIIGAIEDDVGLIRRPPTRHRHKQVLPSSGGINKEVSGVGRDALRSVGSDDIAKVDVVKLRAAFGWIGHDVHRKAKVITTR